jgi:hypothetical protein
MKKISTSFILVFIAILTSAQTELKKAYLRIEIPVTLSLRYQHNNPNLDVYKDETKERQQYISVSESLDNVRISGNSFSGVSRMSNSSTDEVVFIKGTFSADHSTIQNIKVDYHLEKYNLHRSHPKARIVEIKKASFTLTNIPKKYSGYQYDFTQSKISDVSWFNYKRVGYHHGVYEERTFNLVGIDKEKITKYSTIIHLNLTPSSNTYKENNYSKIGVTVDESLVPKDTNLNISIPSKGVMAKLIHELSNTPGLKVLERHKLDKLLEEIKLSESGLVTEETSVKSGKMIEEDILVIIRVKEIYYNEDKEAKGVMLDTKIVMKETGEVIEPKIESRFNADSPTSIIQSNFMAKNIYAYLMNEYF